MEFSPGVAPSGHGSHGRAIVKTILTMILALGLALPAAGAAAAGKHARVFTGHTYHLGHDRHQGHRHGPRCRHGDRGRVHRRGPGCREVTQYARLPEGHAVPVRRTLCRDRYGRTYVLPNSTRFIRGDAFRH